jgi:hypothetical protein
VAQVAQGLFRLSLVRQYSMLVAEAVVHKQVALMEVRVLLVAAMVVVMLQVLALCGQLLVLLIRAEEAAALAVAVLAAQILLLLVQLAVLA